MTTNTASSIGAGGDIAGPVRVGEVVAEKYVVESTLGIGGMGVVVAARDRLLDRPVAIKFLLPKLVGSDTAVQRFTREARAATRITSEHVVRLLEIEKLPDGTPFFVMEYLEGSDLRALLRERGVLSPSLAVDYVLQAAQAVAEGHVKGVVHRDIKPSNLFLTQRADGTPLIKVLDFGIAKTTEREQPESTALTSSDDVRLGSPAYMPPEQLQDPRNVDTRSDIWSLGATLYELICGRPPFEGNGYLELATAILKEPPVPLSERDVPSTVPRALEQVLRKCLEKDRNNRYTNAAELAAALAPFGSEDARMSAARVSGMFGSQSSLPAVTKAVPASDDDCEPTLDVAGETNRNTPGSAPGRGRRTSDVGAVASEAPPAANRNWLIIGVAAAAIGAVFVLRSPTTSPTSAVPNAAVPAVAPAAAPAAVAPVEAKPAVTATPEAPTEPQAVAPESEKPKAASVPAPSKGAATAPNESPRETRAAVKPRETQPASLHVEAPPEAPAVAKPEPAPAEAATGSSLGRSEEIERLIEERH
ncbi:MAG TPA: protein kinase [Polyangiaceae bacterium]|nr:protein kinase [Polyangiaceae bacterium]